MNIGIPWRALRRWRPRFSLRTMLVAFTVVALLIGHVANRAKEQRRVRSAIHRIDGNALYKSKFTYMQLEYSFLPAGPTCCLETWEPDGIRRWLPSWIDSDWVDSIVAVELEEKGVSRELLAGVGGLPHLEYLSLAFSEYQFDDLELLAGCRSLKYLHLHEARIGGARLSFLSDLKSLEELALSYTNTTDQDLESFVHLPNLRRLWLSETQVTSDGLATLTACDKLEQLILFGTKVDDDSLQHLKTLRCLQVLDLQRTLVTAQGVSELREALPNCKVFWEENWDL